MTFLYSCRNGRSYRILKTPISSLKRSSLIFCTCYNRTSQMARFGVRR